MRLSTLACPPPRLVLAIALVLLAGLHVPGNAAPPPSAAAAVSPDGHWTNLFESWPIGVDGQLVHDTQRNRGLLVANGEIWELSLAPVPHWTLIARPSGIHPGTCVYDQAGDRLLIVEGGPTVTIWQMPLSGPLEWSELAATAAPANWESFSVSLHPTIRRLIVYGGYLQPGPPTVVNWKYAVDLNVTPAAWSNVGGTGGVTRYAHSAVIDAVHSQLIVYGGYNMAFSPIGAGQVDPSGGFGNWTMLPGLGPLPRIAPSMVHDVARNRVILYGGYVSGVDNTAWTLALDGTWAWGVVPASGPKPDTQKGGSAILDAARDRMVVYGSVFQDDLWSLSLPGTPTWTDHGFPHPLWGGATVLDVAGQRLVRHGDGVYADDSQKWNDVWQLALPTRTWTKLSPAGTPPTPRRSQTLVSDPVRNRLLVFGGSDVSSTWLNDLWALSLGSTPTWSALAPAGTPPTPRPGAAAICDPLRDRLLLFGGLGSGAYLNEVWALTLQEPMTWTQLSTSGPPPPGLSNPRSTYDSGGDRMIVLGDPTFAEPIRPAWALSLSGTPTWESLPVLPAGKMYPSYDGGRNRLVALDEVGRTWAMNLSGTPAWTLLSPDGPAPTVGATTFYDPSTDHLIVHGTVGARTHVLDFGGPLDVPEAPAMLQLSAGRPNPAMDRVTFAFRLPSPMTATLVVSDISGRTIRRLEGRAAASGTIEWDLRDEGRIRVPPGLYFASLQAGELRRTGRVVVAR